MHLALSLYEEGVKTNEDLVGDVRLESGNVVIEQRATYLDSWLAAIVEGIASLKSGESVSVELLEEPDPLRFDFAESGVSISYGKRTLTARSLADLEDAAVVAAASFLSDVERLTGSREGQVLDGIGDFVRGTRARRG